MKLFDKMLADFSALVSIFRKRDRKNQMRQIRKLGRKERKERLRRRQGPVD